MTFTERYEQMTPEEKQAENRRQEIKVRDAWQRKLAREARHANRLAIIARRQAAGY